jgi:hypothetical protein
MPGRKEYVEGMPLPPDEDVEPRAHACASLARQWRHAALALAVLFASLPLMGKLFLNSWRFDGALQIAGLCLFAAGYLYFVGRESQPPTPDLSAISDEAFRLAASAEAGSFEEPEAAEAALRDLTEAIRLAPGEPHFYILRSRLFALLGHDSAARADLETAARLSGDTGEHVGQE